MQSYLTPFRNVFASACFAGTVALAGTASMAVAETEEEPTAEEQVELQAKAAQKSAAEMLPLEDLQMFTSVFGQIRAKYVDEIDDRTLLRNAIKGMLEGLDPHSVYLDRDSFEELQEHTSGEFGGLGMEVGMEDGFVKVIAPIDDTPAEQAGVMSGDLIIKLDNSAVKGLSLQESVNLMRGKPGTDIDLTIVREGGPPFVLTLTRAVIEVKSVRTRILEPNYGYLRISQFQANTGIGAGKAIAKMSEDNPELEGLIIDLRNNPGGVLQAAVDITDLFIDSGTIVYTEGRSSVVESRFSAESADQTKGLPLVVLVNGGSASASEIVAGALQDHGRAVIVGTKTFGKGSVQSVLPLSNEHGMKLTTALYFTPNGRSIQAQGIEPDIEVKRANITEFKPNILAIREADLSGRLANGNNGGNASDSGADNADDDSSTEKSLASRDNQLYEALNMLKSMSLLKRKRSPMNTNAVKDVTASRSALQ